MDRLVHKHFTGYLHKLNPKDLRGKEIFFLTLTVLSLVALIMNVCAGSLFCLVNLIGTLIWVNILNSYYRDER